MKRTLKDLIGGGILSPSTKICHFFLIRLFLLSGASRIYLGGFHLCGSRIKYIIIQTHNDNIVLTQWQVAQCKPHPLQALQHSSEPMPLLYRAIFLLLLPFVCLTRKLCELHKKDHQWASVVIMQHVPSAFFFSSECWSRRLTFDRGPIASSSL